MGLGLTARLARTLGAVAAPPPPPRLAAQLAQLAHRDALWAKVATWGTGSGGAEGLQKRVGGDLIQVPGAGAFIRVQRRYRADDHHGHCVLGGFRAAPTAHLEAVTADPRLAGFDPEDTLFLDIEATGLEHGAGTVAFLIGVAYYDADGLVLEQLILRDPSDERALLLYLTALLDRFRFLVSFNGKSYDLSVLQARLVMHRLASRRGAALKLRPHLDLLHLSRNLVRGVWADTRLQTLERELLGVHREDDVPGSLVPTCWFTYSHTGDPEPVADVARHNLDDVLTMVVLAQVLAEKTAPDADAHALRPVVRVNLARLWLRRRHPERAQTLLDTLPERLLDAERDAERWALAARCARTRRDHRSRVAALHALLQHLPDDAAAWSQLAIAHERLHQHGAALAAAKRAYALTSLPVTERRITRLAARCAAAGPAIQ